MRTNVFVVLLEIISAAVAVPVFAGSGAPERIMTDNVTINEVSDETRDDVYRSYFQQYYKYEDYVIVKTDIDMDNDGVIDSTVKSSYNDEGLIIKDVCSGEENYTTTYSYDENGYVTELVNEYPDSTAQEVHTYFYASDAVEITHVIKGTVTNVYTYEYDSDGNHEGVLYTYTVSGYSLSDYHAYEYNSDDQLIREEWDSLSNGSIDETRAYTYDDNGNRIKDEYFVGDATDPYYIIIGTYDSDNLCEKEEFDYDNDDDGTVCDGTIDAVYYYTWQHVDALSDDDDNNDSGSDDGDEETESGSGDASSDETSSDSGGGGGCFIRSVLSDRL